MTEEETKTRSSNPPPDLDDHPAVRAAERFAHLVGVMLESLQEEIKQLRLSVDRLDADVAMKNGELREVKDEVLTLQNKVGRLERHFASTEPPEAA